MFRSEKLMKWVRSLWILDEKDTRYEPRNRAGLLSIQAEAIPAMIAKRTYTKIDELVRL